MAVSIIGVANNGGYFPESWGWLSLTFGWLATIGVLLGRTLSRLAATAAAGLLGLTVWAALSSTWSFATASGSVAERSLTLTLGVLAFLVVVRKTTLEIALSVLVGGAGLVCAYAVASRLFPSHFGVSDPLAGNRLSAPVGYWNGLGIYAVIGLVIALGLVARGRLGARLVAGAVTPVLALAAYLTFSRGAAIAFGVACVATFALDSRRMEWVLRVALVGGLALIGVVVASRSDALTTSSVVSLQHATVGGGVRATLAAMTLASIAASAISGRTFELGARFEAAGSVTLGVLGTIVLAAGLVLAGGPTGIWDKFAAPPTAVHGSLNERLLSFSGNYRTPLWSAALDEYRAHPLLGGGGGSFEAYYLLHRTRPDKVRNAHDLYLETLAELGPVGLLFLLVGLCPPLAVAWRARAHPLVPAMAGAYIALLVHMIVDWDWQLTGVALTGLFCGAGVLVADGGAPMSPRFRVPLIFASVCGIVASVVVLVGNVSMARAVSAAGDGRWVASARDAEHARTWAPWSSEPLRLLGEAQLGHGQPEVAAVTFRRALAKSPDDWNLWFDLARATLGKAQRNALDRAAALNPLSPEVAEFRSELAQDKTITVVPNQS